MAIFFILLPFIILFGMYLLAATPIQHHGYSPLVEPAPDAFPIRYRSPYVEPPSWRSGTVPDISSPFHPIAVGGMQDTPTPVERHPPQSISAIFTYEEVMAAEASDVKDACASEDEDASMIVLPRYEGE